MFLLFRAVIATSIEIHQWCASGVYPEFANYVNMDEL